jgi:hypothetical protein
MKKNSNNWGLFPKVSGELFVAVWGGCDIVRPIPFGFWCFFCVPELGMWTQLSND